MSADSNEKPANNSQAEKHTDSFDSQIHSANSWEKADLGDVDRKQKFLRLMGAAKKEHQGRFVIGDKEREEGREKYDTSKLSNDLESQYEQSMEHRRIGGRRGHIGLGFHKEEEDKKSEERKQHNEKRQEEEEKSSSGKGDGEEDKERGERKRNEEEGEKRRHSDDSKGSSEKDSGSSSSKKMKMNFVKSSS